MFSAARWRLTAVFTAILAVILLVAGVVVYFTTSSLIYSRVDAELADKAESQMFLLDDRRGGPGPDEDGDGQKFDPGGYFYAVLESDGDVTESSYGFGADSLASPDTVAEAKETGHAIEDVTSDGESQRVYVVASHESDGQLLLIGRSIEPEQNDLAQLRNILLIVALVSFLPIIAGGYLISGRVLRPIQKSVDAQRAFIADASHELRTPVAVVRTSLKQLRRESDNQPWQGCRQRTRHHK